jgi:hypothetical protein
MLSSERARERVKLLEEKLSKLRAEKGQLLARASKAERRRETRQKIVIGGTVLAALGEGGVPPLQTAEDLQRWLDERLSRPQDRAVCALVKVAP